MINQEVQEKIFNLFESEIVAYDDGTIRDGMTLLLKALVSYKLTADVNYIFSKDSKEYPLEIHRLTPDYSIAEADMANCLIIGGAAVDGSPSESISAFINMQFDHSESYQVIVNEEKRIVQITTENDKYPIYLFYLLASIMPKLLHWYFKSEDLQKIENIVRTFFQKNTAATNAHFEALVVENNLLFEANKLILESLGKKMIKTKEVQVGEELTARRNELDSAYRKIANLNQIIERLLDEQRILTFKQEEYETPLKEITNFLESTSEDIRLTEVSQDGYIVLEVTANLDEVPSEQYEDCIAQAKNSEYFHIKGKDRNYLNVEDLKLFYKKIFIDRELKLKVKARIRVYLFSYSLEALDIVPGPNYIEHPHLRGSLGCFGTAGVTISQYLGEMRYTEAISQILYAASQSTLSDLTANRSLIMSLNNSDIRPILLPNGEYANVEESIKYIKEHNKEIEE